MTTRKTLRQKWLGAACLLEEQSSLPWERSLILVVIIVTIAFVKWAHVTPVEELVITTGELVPEQKIVSVQGGMTGVVQDIYVTEGSQVKQDEPLLKLQVEDAMEDVRRYDIQRKGLKEELQFIEKELSARSSLSNEGLFPPLNLIQLQAKRMEILNKIEELDAVSAYRFGSAKQSIVRAPTSGRVHEIRIPHKNASILAGEILMEIVPEEVDVIADLKVKPSDIGHVKVDQTVTLRVTTYDPARYGTAQGKISYISPATIVGRDGLPFFKAQVSLNKQHLVSLTTHQEFPLKIGMMVDAEIKTGSKTILEYLLKPVMYLAHDAMHER